MLVPLTLNGRIAAPQQLIEGDEVRSAVRFVQEWIDQGWQVIGRMYTSFVGYETEGDFWRETYASLGMMPEARLVGRSTLRRRRRTKRS